MASRRAASAPSAARRKSPGTHRRPVKDRRLGKKGTVLTSHLRERRRLPLAPAPPRLSPPIMPIMPDVHARSEAVGVVRWIVIRGGVSVVTWSIVAVGIVRRGERATNQGPDGKANAHATPSPPPSMPPMSATPTTVPPLNCLYVRS
jgi:hypothetical protein